MLQTSSMHEKLKPRRTCMCTFSACGDLRAHLLHTRGLFSSNKRIDCSHNGKNITYLNCSRHQDLKFGLKC